MADIMSQFFGLQRANLLQQLLGPKMRRRRFILLIAGTATWSLAARGQESTTAKVGFLNSASADGYASMAAAFKSGLKETGFAEGQNVTIDYRWADNQYDRLPRLAADLVNRRVNLIFANSPSIPAVLAATRTWRKMVPMPAAGGKADMP